MAPVETTKYADFIFGSEETLPEETAGLNQL
jgi:hypothetical protein